MRRDSGKKTVDESGIITDKRCMNSISHLLIVARAFQAATGLDQSTVSWRALGDVRKLAALEEGKDIQVTRFERGMLWLSENWPDAVAWPNGVPRPRSHLCVDASATR
jgi:hypothetical protein